MRELSRRYAIDSEAYALLLASADAALEVLYLQEYVELENELIKLAEDAAEIQRNRAELKSVTVAQAIEAEINLAEIELDRLSSEPQLDVVRIRLSRALGLCQPVSVSIEGTLEIQPVEDIPLGELMAEAERARPELAQAEAAIRKAAARWRRPKPARYRIFKWDRVVPADLEDGGADQAGLRFNTDLPWFDRKQGDICSAASKVRVNEALRDLVRLTSLHDVADAFVQLRDEAAPCNTTSAFYR